MQEFGPIISPGGDGISPNVNIDTAPTRVSTFADADGGSVTWIEWGRNESFTSASTVVFGDINQGPCRR